MPAANNIKRSHPEASKTSAALDKYSAVVIGGGFYGLRIALHLRREVGLSRVLVLEQTANVMAMASYSNQARVHNGYHYPRSILTGYRSRVSMPKFIADFPDSIHADFDHYYAVSRRSSKVTARQFEEFSRRIGAPLETAPRQIEQLFDRHRVEKVYRVREPVFDATKVRDRLLGLIEESRGIDVRRSTTVFGVSEGDDGLVVATDGGTVAAGQVFNTTYAGINAVQQGSGLPTIPLQHELTEMALIGGLGSVLEATGITVMDGPFFSILPFPDRQLHTLSHVRYTPHVRWTERNGEGNDPPGWGPGEALPPSNFPRMRADLARYLPSLRSITHEDSLWSIKTVLPQSSRDDSRPILYRSGYRLRGYTVVMGGKLDNVYDALEEISRSHGGVT